MRAFVAIDLDEAIRDRLTEVGRQFDDRRGGLRRTPAQSLHLTLRFLGEIDEPTAAALSARLEAVSGDGAPFELESTHLGCFPPRGPARVLWAGVRDGSGRLDDLARAVEEGCRESGLAPERKPFRAHITLARIRDPRTGRRVRDRLERDAELSPFLQTVTEIRLKQSTLRPDGAVYTDLNRFPLGAGDAPEGRTTSSTRQNDQGGNDEQ